MTDHDEVFVGIDVAKLRNAVAVADGGRMPKRRGRPPAKEKPDLHHG